MTYVLAVALFVCLLAVAPLLVYLALRELGAFDRPPEPPSVLESGPNILSVDLRDREDR